ncbi:MAG TPA: FAD-dependent oxidoreductase [Hypericibacter adhaerens]|uniref:NAD(P)/FAD-dependent oxidoreductase n=1 Tax=Hypericibacter adhaerens TaxID=2602016 RepID=UPI002C1D66A6|nr:FAD-dependent oxidoreductase [Hypericibacter adhaerens]HWA44247.1 FAD-dependent oxidoreductase [Hypericibacter adhaerens]
MDPIIVVGAGQAGVALAAKLRALGYDGPLLLIGQEPVLPYQRPPLSKKYILGELALDRLLIRPPGWYEEQKIECRLSTRVAHLDPAAKTVSLDDGTDLRYSKLALATGASPLVLPAPIGGKLEGVLRIRSLADADRLAPLLQPGKKLLVIGGGYIGLEAAAVARMKGLEVTLIEKAERILQRVAAPLTSDYFRALHGRHGVSVREAVTLERLEGTEGRLTGARLADGTRIEADLAIVGIGVLPDKGLAIRADLDVDDGIIVDGQCRTSDPDIFAAGDCTSFPWRGERIRLESVGNAIEQAEHAAACMLGETKDYDPVPWFWSDQYDVKLQIAGFHRGYTDTVLRPGKREQSQSVWYYRGEALVAVDAMNDALAYGIGKKVLEARRSIPKAAAADPAVELKTWLTAS